MNISEVFTAGKNAVERVPGKTDIAAAAGRLAAGGMDFEADVVGQCGSSARAICVTSFCS
jgi:hypothetical protein